MAEKKASMTDRQRVEAMLRHEKPDRVPVWPFAYAGFAAVTGGYTIDQMFNKPEKCLEAERKACQEFDWVFTPMIGYAGYGGWEFGGDIKWPSSEYAQAPTVSRLPVETEDDAWNLKTPEIANAGIVPLKIEFYKLAASERLDNEPFNVFASIHGPFNTASNICSVEKLCKWLIKKPDLAHHMLRLATDHIKEFTSYMHGIFGIEGVVPFTGEAAANANMISPKQFEEFALPYLKEICQHALDLGYNHIYTHVCGEQNPNLFHWATINFGNPGIISIGHEEDIETVSEFFPKDIIVGNIEPAIIQTGTPDEVYALCKECIEKGKKHAGGFALSPGCELPPMAPLENVRMMVKAANDFGWYD